MCVRPPPPSSFPVWSLLNLSDFAKKNKIWKNLEKSENFGDTLKIRHNLNYVHNPRLWSIIHKKPFGPPLPCGTCIGGEIFTCGTFEWMWKIRFSGYRPARVAKTPGNCAQSIRNQILRVSYAETFSPTPLGSENTSIRRFLMKIPAGELIFPLGPYKGFLIKPLKNPKIEALWSSRSRKPFHNYQWDIHIDLVLILKVLKMHTTHLREIKSKRIGFFEVLGIGGFPPHLRGGVTSRNAVRIFPSRSAKSTQNHQKNEKITTNAFEC